MMETKEYIGIAVLVAIIGSITFIGGASLDDPDAYWCEASKTVANCERFGRYIADNGKCYLSAEDAEITGVTYKICRAGWVEIVGEVLVEPEPEPEPSPPSGAKGIYGPQWKCSPPPDYGCVKIVPEE
jgi:hypothetical protein